jgi:hypothetical protein
MLYIRIVINAIPIQSRLTGMGSPFFGRNMKYACTVTIWFSDISAVFCHALTTNLTQHDSHGLDEQPKTIDYHYHPLHMSRDIGKDQHGVNWFFG